MCERKIINVNLFFRKYAAFKTYTLKPIESSKREAPIEFRNKHNFIKEFCCVDKPDLVLLNSVKNRTNGEMFWF